MFAYLEWPAIQILTVFAVVCRLKFWSSEKIGPGDQNSRNNGPPGPFSPEKFGPDLE